jgi:hypothetical protein
MERRARSSSSIAAQEEGAEVPYAAICLGEERRAPSSSSVVAEEEGAEVLIALPSHDG